MRSIRGILFRYISVVWVVGLSSVAGVTFFLSKKALEQFAQDDYEHLIHSVGHQVETSFQEQLLALDKIAELPGFQPFEPAKAAALAENFLQYDNIFSTIHAYYADGRLAFAKKRALFPPYNIEPNFNQKYDKEYIQLAKRVLQNNERAASTAFVTSLGEIYQTYLVPIRDPKRPHAQPIGLVSGAVFPKVKGLNKWIEGLKLGEDNFILVTDPKGQIVVESGKIDPALRPILSDRVAGFLKDAYPGGAYNGAAGSPPTVKARVRGGIPYLLVAEAVPSLNLLIVLGASTARIEERVSSWYKVLVLIFSVGLLVHLAVTAWIGKKLSRPFQEIADKLDGLERGKFDGRFSPTSMRRNDEIGLLAGKVQKISDRVEKDEILGEFWKAVE